MNDTNDNDTVTVNGQQYALDSLSDAARAQISNIKFSDAQISQLKNELVISNTAKRGYLSALNKELSKADGTDD